MMIGCSRVSTDEQNLDLQRDALKDAGCEIVFVPTFWKLDRLGRSPFDLVNFVEDLRARDIGLKVLIGQRSMRTRRAPKAA